MGMRHHYNVVMHNNRELQKSAKTSLAKLKAARDDLGKIVA